MQPTPTHKHTHDQATTAADILVIGDSTIKHLQPRRLSRKRRVICRTMRGAKIEDVAQRANDIASKHSVSEVIIHVGTNNTSDDPETIAAKITSLCDTLQATSVTISSIIHRQYQSLPERKKVDDANELLNSITTCKHWGFIDNRNINAYHLMTDGVHLDSVGVGILAKNIITHIAGPSEMCVHHHRMTSRRREPPLATYCSLKPSINRLQLRATSRRVFGYRISIIRAPSRYDINHAARRFGEQLNRTTNGADTSKRSEHC